MSICPSFPPSSSCARHAKSPSGVASFVAGLVPSLYRKPNLGLARPEHYVTKKMSDSMPDKMSDGMSDINANKMSDRMPDKIVRWNIRLDARKNAK